MTPRPRLLAALLLAAPAVASAADPAPAHPSYDGNIDLIRPFFAPENLPGIDVPDNKRGGSVRWGVAMMYTNSPLVLYQFDQEVGSVVNNRFSTFAGVSVDVSRAFTVRASIPLYYQWGSDVPRYANDGVALGDASVGFHFAAYRTSHVGLGVRLDVNLPTSKPAAYAGDRLPVFNPAFLMMFDVARRVRIASDLGVNLRPRTVVTTEDLAIGQELVWNVGVRGTVIPDRLDLGVGIYSKFGFSHFLGAGESAGEFMADVAIKTVKWLWVDVGAGRGFTKGYGSSDVRGWVQLRFQKNRPSEEEEAEARRLAEEEEKRRGGIIIDVRQPGTVIGTETAAPVTEPEDIFGGGIVKRVKNEIKLKYEIQFEKSTASLLPESYPIVDAIADLLNHDARIGHVVIEGHASTEGEYKFNYELSVARAKSIWERLLDQGVHPSRLSYRGMGEVKPLESTEGTEDLARERRVVFYVVEHLDEISAEAKHYDLDQQYPWNGQPYRAVQPTLPAVEEMPEEYGPPPAVRPERTDDELKGADFGRGTSDDFEIEPSEPEAPPAEPTPEPPAEEPPVEVPPGIPATPSAPQEESK